MSDTGQKRFHVRLVQPSAPANDLGEMSEAKLYGYFRPKLGESRAENVMSELEHSRSAVTEFEASLGLKRRVEIIEI